MYNVGDLMADILFFLSIQLFLHLLCSLLLPLSHEGSPLPLLRLSSPLSLPPLSPLSLSPLSPPPSPSQSLSSCNSLYTPPPPPPPPHTHTHTLSTSSLLQPALCGLRSLLISPARQPSPGFLARQVGTSSMSYMQ